MLRPVIRSLEQHGLRLFISGQFVSLIGTWMRCVAQSWLVLELPNSSLKLGLIGTLQYSPMLCLSFLAFTNCVLTLGNSPL